MSSISSLLAKLPIPASLEVFLIDVGARWGANAPWNQLDERYIRYLGFEPDEEECRRLVASAHSAQIEYCPVALSSEEESHVLHITREPGCSSIFEPNQSVLEKYQLSERWDVLRRVPIETVPLATILERKSVIPDALKIDVQGAALKVLEGAGTHLNSVLLMDIEVEFAEMYLGEPRYGDVDRFVRARGFELLDMNKYYARRKILDSRHVSRGQVLFADVLYVKSVERFYSEDMTVAERERKLWSLVVMLSLYGHFDMALEFVLHRKSPLSESDKGAITSAIGRHTAISQWKLLLFDNGLADKLGYVLSLLGNAIQIRSRRFGWGSDQSAVDSRYKYFLRHPLLRLFRK